MTEDTHLAEPMFARGTTSALGKLDDTLERVRISSETKAGLQLRAAQCGMPLAEYVRRVLDCHVFGAEHVASVEAERIRRIGGLVG